MPKIKNTNLHKAKAEKNDEFYTQLNDVANELSHYKEHFKGKVIFCNCDDPTWSAFWKYFHLNFEVLGLKRLISTHYDREKPTYKMIYEGGNDNDVEAGEKIPLEGNGDFRNAECVDLLKEADVVVTNPPFSCYREYVAQLMEYGKDYIISRKTLRRKTRRSHLRRIGGFCITSTTATHTMPPLSQEKQAACFWMMM